MASPEGLEPPTSDLEGRCSIQLSYGLVRAAGRVVGAAGFELATYWSQTSCATRLRYAPKPRRLYSAPARRRGRRRQHELPRDGSALLDVLFACTRRIEIAPISSMAAST